jgi:SAM domain (Sterile alpha motif)
MSTSTTIEDWLARFGLSRLAATFRDNGIDLDVVAQLSDDDLRELGLTIGDRKRVLAAVSVSATPATAPSNGASSRCYSATSPIRPRCRRASIRRTCAT